MKILGVWEKIEGVWEIFENRGKKWENRGKKKIHHQIPVQEASQTALESKANQSEPIRTI